jgi:diguanylate cyclase (GGDEF)-like protein/PAS domain S-box-containing protein
MHIIRDLLRANWLRRDNWAFTLSACFLFEAAASAFPYLIKTPHAIVPLIWVANGVLLAYLLLEPRSRWLSIAGVGLAAQATAITLIAPHASPADLLTPSLNVAEVLISAWLIRSRSPELRRFADKVFLTSFIAFAVIAAPLASGLIFAAVSVLLRHASLLTDWKSWTIAHALGSAIATPAALALLRINLRDVADWRKQWVFPILPVLVTVVAFSQVRVPLLLLVLPLMVLVFLQLGLEWSAFVLFVVTETAALFTVHGLGPLALIASSVAIDPAVLLQLFLAEGVFSLYCVSAVVEHYKVSDFHLQKIAELHSLVSENSRDAIILSDLSGKRSYGSAAAENIGGWRPEALLTEEGLEQVHPADRAKVQSIVEELRAGAQGAVMECRIRREGDSDYIWVEASLHMLRDPQSGEPRGVLNFVRDISARKDAELQLQEAYNAVEALSVTDPLTGLANRRRFEKTITHEWRRGMRSKEPLSLLMIDVDNFKKYNDNYGHPRGDNCLKQVAEAAMDCVMRPADLVARFGGEEFVVVLPNTDNPGAMHVANLACELMRNRKLPHAGNPPGIVTISVGCATLIPHRDMQVADLIDMADRAVYKAKQSGRNQAFNGSPECEPVTAAAGEAQ